MHEVGLIVISTGEYTKYLPQLIQSFQKLFFHGQADLYVFTDKNIEKSENVHIFKVKHLGWPIMPLMRAKLINKYADKINNEYLFTIDGDTYFKKHVGGEILSLLTATLHRNLERMREDYNYEKREESMAYIKPDEGERYFIGGFIGGEKEMFKSIMRELEINIDLDIRQGIRAIWGDESHINKILIHTSPTKVLGPEYMCPEGNVKFQGRIIHHDKDFKRVNLKDTKENLMVDPKDFENIRFDNTKILITGHKGYIGSRLYKKLKELNYVVYGIDYRLGKDILYTKLPSVDIVFHLAAQSGAIPSMKDPMYDARNNILCTLKLIQHYKHAKFIFTSTGAATEENPASCYGISKQVCEKYLRLLHSNHVILRLSSIFGKKNRGVVDDFIRAKEGIKIFGDGSARRDFVHVYDIVRALAKSIEWKSNKEYCLGSGKGTTILDLAKATGKNVTILPPREGELDDVVLSNTAPDWKPKIDPINYIKAKCKQHDNI